MARRGTTITNSQYQRRKTLYAINAVNHADVIHNGAAGMELVGTMGKSGAAFNALSFDVATNDTLDFVWGDIWDVDLAYPIYFDLLWSGIALEATEVVTYTGKYLQGDVDIATANKFDSALLTLMSPASVTITAAATDIGNVRISSGLYIPASAVTNNEDVLATRLTFTAATNVTTTEFCPFALRMKYTSRAGY